MMQVVNIQMKDLMTREVVTIGETDLMINVKQIFDDNNFHHLPVVNQADQLVGIISKHDYNKMLTTFSVFKNSRAEVANKKFMMSLMVKDVMTKQVARLYTYDSLTTALGIFKENLFHALPIINEQNEVVGIVTTYDLLNYAFEDGKVFIG